MFELRTQSARANGSGETAGPTIAAFAGYPAAVAALRESQEQLDRDLMANGEGSMSLSLCQVVVEVGHGREKGWLWSTYRPPAAP